MRTEAGSQQERRMSGPDRGRHPGIRLAWFTVVLLSFLAGLGLANLWSSSGASETTPEPGAEVTPTALLPTQMPHPTPSIEALTEPASLSTIYLTIAPDDMAQVAAKREEALKTWILQSDVDDFVDAIIQFEQDPPVSGKLRLKGDWGDHFYSDKWSYRIETRGGAGILGMRVFSLQDPSTRAFLNEWLFMAHLRAEGILSVGYDFVHGVQNGEPMGIYAVEEGFAKELLESQGRRESVIVRYSEDLLWAFWTANENDLSTPPGIHRFHIIDEFSSGAVDADPLLSAQRDAALGKMRAWQQGALPFSEVFDVDLTARYWAIIDIWGAQHALQWHNLRYYYNPVTTLLEPIGFDAHPLAAGSEVDAATLPGRLAVIDSGDAEVYRRYTQYLWDFSQPGYLEDFHHAYGEAFERLQAALWPEFGDQVAEDGERVLAAPWDKLAERQHALREMLTPFQMAYAYRPTLSPTTTLWLDVGNLAGFPVEVVAVQVGDMYAPASPEWLSDDSASEVVPMDDTQNTLVLQPLAVDAAYMPYVRLEIEPSGTISVPDGAITGAPDRGLADGLADPAGSIELVTRLWGLTQTVTQPVLSAYPLPAAGSLPAAPTLEQALARHPMLRVSESDPHMLTALSGAWSMTMPVVLPQDYGLSLAPGTTLLFDADSYLLSRGPLIFRGTEAAPIHLGPIGERWHGVVVLGSDQPSYWDFVTVSGAQPVALPGWTLTGGVTFYESAIALNHVSLRDSNAEDAINVIRSDFVFEHSLFANTYSDAFDADFSQGQVSDCSFADIGGDAIDISGSQVTVRRVRMVEIGDKAISAGEDSYLSGEGVNIESAGLGVVSKDLSHVEVEDVTVAGIRVAALAAYVKKPTYGPATLTAKDMVWEGIAENAMTLVQTGSWIDLEGERIWGSDIDVEALYLD